MKVALVAPGPLRGSTSLERRVDVLARALAQEGAEVDVVTRWEHARHRIGSWDAVHLHAARGSFGIATGGAPSRRLVFTPHAPIQRLMRWPYAPLLRAIVDRAARIVALSRLEAELIRGIFPHAAPRVQAMPMAVDVAAIEAARPFEHSGPVIVVGGRLDRRVERAIAAMASLDPRFRLVILGDGSAARRLQRYAGDLRVSGRVDFAGRASACLHYRWLRTARVVVALTEDEPSGSELIEAVAAGATVVASDVEGHRDAAAVAPAAVKFVASECSPLELADAIAAMADVDVPPAVQLPMPPGRAAAQSMLALYRSLSARAPAPRVAISR